MNTKSIAIICITIIICGILFWPTLYRYEKLTIKEYSFIVKTNRLTGYTERFIGDKWIPQKNEVIIKKSSPLPLEEKIKVTGNAGFSYAEYFIGKIYNGSSWTITELTVHIIAKEKDGLIRWDRIFKTNIHITPLSTGNIFISITDTKDALSEWNIEEVLGYQK